MKKFILLLFIYITPITISAEVVERILAIVNNDVILLSDLENLKKDMSSGGMFDDFLLFGRKAKDIRKSQKDLIDLLINEKIMDSEIRKLSLSVSSDRIDQEIRSIAQRNQLSKEQLIQALKKQGVSISKYQDFLKKRLERHSLVERAISSKIKVTDEEIAEFYLKNYEGAQGSIFEYSISHIMFQKRGLSFESALKQANIVLDKLKSGLPFENLVKEYSEDPNISTGGFLGNFKAGELSKDFEFAIKKLNINETSKIVRTHNSLHILKLNGRKLVSNPRFEREKEKIRALISEKLFKSQFKSWLNRKRDDSFVRIN